MQVKETYSLELLADFVAGMVDKSTHDRIMNAMEGNEDLAATVRGMIHVYAESGKNHDELLAFIERKPSQPFREETPVRKLNPRIITAAAAIILVLIASWFTFFNDRAASELVAAYSTEVFDPAVTVRGAGEAEMAVVAQLYSESRFSEVTKLLSEVSERSSVEDLYLGLSHFNTGEFQQALIHLDKVASSDSRFTEHATWHKAICEIQLGNTEASLISLNEVANGSGYRKEEAKELLELLSSPE